MEYGPSFAIFRLFPIGIFIRRKDKEVGRQRMANVNSHIAGNLYGHDHVFPTAYGNTLTLRIVNGQVVRVPSVGGLRAVLYFFRNFFQDPRTTRVVRASFRPNDGDAVVVYHGLNVGVQYPTLSNASRCGVRIYFYGLFPICNSVVT